MKILILTQWYDPEPTFKGQAFARELRAQGHEVQVITGFPNYPGGKLYSGYRLSWLQREHIDGVEVCRVPLYPSHDGSGIKRAMNYASFAISSCLFGLFMARRADVIYAYHPPLTTGLSAALIGWLRRMPVVYDIQDLWPDTLRATGMLNDVWALKIVETLCQWVYRRASALVVLSPGFRTRLIDRGVPPDKLHLIYNWCDESALKHPALTVVPQVMAGRFNVVFAGTMGKAQALDSVINAAAIVAKQVPKIQFVFVGGGIEVPRLQALASEKSPSNVVFLPRMPMQEVGVVLSAADVLLVHLRDDPLFAITVPSKTQAYMAMGRPLVMAVSGDAASLVREAQCGKVLNPEDSAALADAVLGLHRLDRETLNAIGRCGQIFYEQQLSLSAGVKRFIQVFEKMSSRA